MDTQKHLNWRPAMSALSFEKYSNAFDANMEAAILAVQNNSVPDAMLYAGRMRALILIVDGLIVHNCQNAASLWAAWAWQLLKLEAEACAAGTEAGRLTVAILAEPIIQATLYTTANEDA